MLALILCSLLSATITGRVVSVHDGDTLTVLEGTTQIKVRLAEIDAPELKQPFGTRAKFALASRVFARDVRVECAGKDRYGRVLGTVFLGQESVNLWLVRNGWAWRYEKYSKSEALKAAQDVAKNGKLGLWADPNPIPPWEWRKQKSPAPAPRASLEPNSTASDRCELLPAAD